MLNNPMLVINLLTFILQTLLWKSLSQLSMRSGERERQSSLAFPNVLLRLCAKPIRVSSLLRFLNLLLLTFVVAKIDAVQAEYSAFETIHETDGLIATSKELKIAYVAYSPLGHGWLVDDFPFKTPDDFPAGDFRLTSVSFHMKSSLPC